MSSKRKPSAAARTGGPRRATVSDVRIIGGRLRGRKLAASGDPRTRPMKHRVREAIFNLISTDSQGKYAIDLFAGTGALGLEAISRGARGATLIEQHVPTAKLIAGNVDALGLHDEVELVVTSAFLWAKRELTDLRRPSHDVAWLVFCSPPYRFYVERCQEMLTLLRSVMEAAPPGSVVVVEADERFDVSQLPEAGADWDVREYPPAVVAVQRSESN